MRRSVSSVGLIALYARNTIFKSSSVSYNSSVLYGLHTSGSEKKKKKPQLLGQVLDHKVAAPDMFQHYHVLVPGQVVLTVHNNLGVQKNISLLVLNTLCQEPNNSSYLLFTIVDTTESLSKSSKSCESHRSFGPSRQ